jgi:hypothetical protein
LFKRPNAEKPLRYVTAGLFVLLAVLIVAR